MNVACLFSANGRVGRNGYWGVTCLNGFVLFAIGLFTGALDAQWGSLLALVAYIVSIVVSCMNHIKRWHDRDKSGAWMLLLFIPVIGWLWSFIELGFLPGIAGPNDYGMPESGSPFLAPATGEAHG